MRLAAQARPFLIAPVLLTAVLAGAAVRSVQDNCGPFTDVSALFCPYVLEAYYTGITAGTSPTTFSPDLPITRGQAAVFATKGLNQALARGSRRAALGQWWTTQNASTIWVSPPLGTNLSIVADGQDIWANEGGPGQVLRFRASDGRLLETWTGAPDPDGLVVAMGKVFTTAAGKYPNGSLNMIDPSQPPGEATHVADVVQSPTGLAFDGARFWVGGQSGISIVTPGSTIPWTSTTVTTGFQFPNSFVYDGSSMWVADYGAGTLLKVNDKGAIVQTVTVGLNPFQSAFDGANIWVPNYGDSTVSVVQASTGVVVATLVGNGLSLPTSASFDGERILVTSAGNNSVSLWQAASLTPIGTVALGDNLGPFRACSDGINFWITVAQGNIVRF